jgi:hypothetical protein
MTSEISGQILILLSLDHLRIGLPMSPQTRENNIISIRRLSTKGLYQRNLDDMKITIHIPMSTRDETTKSESQRPQEDRVAKITEEKIGKTPNLVNGILNGTISVGHSNSGTNKHGSMNGGTPSITTHSLPMQYTMIFLHNRIHGIKISGITLGVFPEDVRHRAREPIMKNRIDRRLAIGIEEITLRETITAVPLHLHHSLSTTRGDLTMTTRVNGKNTGNILVRCHEMISSSNKTYH